eukprot:TRINITY_DN32007_c0_g1_i1.p2 TRINITY_DN32007_c0_g1~~TRINITY_DN32007_c0_g1_i1.p2  ORF type:complete len:395 (+),score=-0.22 TRINITY_DN32007_c0_g1_i1:338-1522(+)
MRVRDPRDHVNYRGPHSRHLLRRDLQQLRLDPPPLLLLEVDRVLAPVGREVPPVLSVGRVGREEDRDAPGQDRVEHGPPSERVARRLHAEARPAHHAQDAVRVVALARPTRALQRAAPSRLGALFHDRVTHLGLLDPCPSGPHKREQVGPGALSHLVLPRQHLVPHGRVEVGRVGYPELVGPVPRIPFHRQHGHVPETWQLEEGVGPEVGPIVRSHEVPRCPSQGQKVVPTLMCLPRRLLTQILRQLDRQPVPHRQVGLAKVAGHVEASVEWHVEELSASRVPRAAGVVLHTCVEDHLGDELVGGVPARRPHLWQRPAKAAVLHVRAHVGVDAQATAVPEEAGIELLRQFIHVHVRTQIARSLHHRILAVLLVGHGGRYDIGSGGQPVEEEEEP